MSRSALIREALRIHPAQAHSDMIGRAIVAGYSRVPPSTPDRWGDPDRQGDASNRELLQRLHADEQAEGSRGIPTEVPLDSDDGAPEPCVLAVDSLSLIRPRLCTGLITRLAPEELRAVCTALGHATGC